MNQPNSARVSVNEPGAWLIPGWLEAQAARLRVDPECIRRFRNRLLKSGVAFERARDELAPSLRSLPQMTLGTPLALELLHCHESAQEGACKRVFRTIRGHRIESVHMRMQSGRAAVCVSSQAGCAVRCTFCATGQSPVVKNLSAPEILSQVLHAVQDMAARGERLRNVVFMGMGEPLHNESALHQSLEALLRPQHFALSARHIMVSTVGVLEPMVKLAQRWPNLGLALSLHSAQPSVREQLIPWAKRQPMSALRDAVRACNRAQSRPLMVEYLLLADLTDTPQAINALLAFCEGLDVRVNLIPYNPVEHAPFRASSHARQLAISSQLKAAGYKVTVRRSLGSDIAAACGQLVQLTPKTKRFGEQTLVP